MLERDERGPNLAVLLDPILKEAADRWQGDWRGDELAAEQLLTVMPPAVASELRLTSGDSLDGDHPLIVVARDAEDCVEWELVRLDGPLRDVHDGWLLEPGQTGLVIGPLGWASKPWPTADVWMGDIFWVLGLGLYNASDFVLRVE